MTSVMEKMFYFGIGAFNLTKERTEKLFNEMVEKGEMSREEARAFIDDAIKKGEEGQKELQRFMTQEMEQIKKNINMVSRAEFEALENRVKELEDKLKSVE